MAVGHDPFKVIVDEKPLLGNRRRNYESSATLVLFVLYFGPVAIPFRRIRQFRSHTAELAGAFTLAGFFVLFCELIQELGAEHLAFLAIR